MLILAWRKLSRSSVSNQGSMGRNHAQPISRSCLGSSQGKFFIEDPTMKKKCLTISRNFRLFKWNCRAYFSIGEGLINKILTTPIVTKPIALSFEDYLGGWAPLDLCSVAHWLRGKWKALEEVQKNFYCVWCYVDIWQTDRIKQFRTESIQFHNIL